MTTFKRFQCSFCNANIDGIFQTNNKYWTANIGLGCDHRVPITFSGLDSPAPLAKINGIR